MGLIVLVLGHSKWFPFDFCLGNKYFEFDKSRIDLYPFESGPDEESKWLTWVGSFQKRNKTKLFNQHKGI